MYPWRAKKDNHLNFNKNEVYFIVHAIHVFCVGQISLFHWVKFIILVFMQIITVLEQQDMWWLGELQTGQRGWFPKSYVKLISAAVPGPVATVARSKNMR